MNTQSPIQDQVKKILHDNNFNQWADKIDRLFLELNSESEESRIKAAQEIQGLCHIRSLGDLNIRTMNGSDWNKKLEKLKKYALKKSAS
jgi:hypothetical protein